jgi:hypothetical protein
MSLGVIPDDRHARVAKHHADMFLSQGSTSHSLGCGGSVELRASCLTKRVVIPGGLVVLVESTTEWNVCPSRSKAWHLNTRDSGWALVLPSGATPGACRVETSMRLQTSDPIVKVGATQQNVSTLLTPSVSDVVIPSFREIFCSRYQMLENALLDSTTTATGAAISSGVVPHQTTCARRRDYSHTWASSSHVYDSLEWTTRNDERLSCPSRSPPPPREPRLSA